MSKRLPHPSAVTPRAAATTLVVRDGPAGLEVLMVRRSPNASFMPGAYVFPGGAVDAADGAAAVDEDPAALLRRIGEVTEVGAQARAYSVAALRECFEECGLWLGLDPAPAAAAGLRARLHAGEDFATLAGQATLPLVSSVLQPWSHWVTPVGHPKRFDTLFFAAPAPAGQLPTVDEGETTTLAWVQPAQALDQRERGQFPMEFATVSTVQSLTPFASAAALLAHAAAQRHLPPLHPRLRLDETGHVAGVLLPGQPGYDEAFQLP